LALQGYCVPGCAEDVIGITFYKYILTNVASINGVELLSAIGKKCLHMESLIDAPWVSLCTTIYSPSVALSASVCVLQKRCKHV